MLTSKPVWALGEEEGDRNCRIGTRKGSNHQQQGQSSKNIYVYLITEFVLGYSLSFDHLSHSGQDWEGPRN